MESVWTDGMIDRLREFCKTTISNSGIAQALNEEFKTGFTRNAIIGKRARLGFDRPRSVPLQQKPRTPRPKRFARFHPRQTTTISEPLIVPTTFPHACDLLTLNNFRCRWPIGEVGSQTFFFCGEPEADLTINLPYCVAHTRMAAA
jgi:GcrA cell cycle regulator